VSSPKTCFGVPRIILKDSLSLMITNYLFVDCLRLTIRLNTSQPVSVIREFICNAVPDQAYKVFALMTTFPNKEIEDEHLTVEQAKLANAVVMQKMKE
jgi:hypothetical protein